MKYKKSRIIGYVFAGESSEKTNFMLILSEMDSSPLISKIIQHSSIENLADETKSIYLKSLEGLDEFYIDDQNLPPVALKGYKIRPLSEYEKKKFYNLFYKNALNYNNKYNNRIKS
jgi:hypothetical protein